MIRILLILLSVLWTAAPALAELSPREHYQRGLSLYQEKQYAAALTEFEAAYAGSQLPRLLLNIGQTCFMLGRYEQAMDIYARYLAVDSDPRSELRARAERRLQQSRGRLAALVEGTQRAQGQPLLSPLRPEPGAAPAAASGAPEIRPLYRRWWFWGALGLASAGALGIALGVSLGLPSGEHRSPIVVPSPQ